MLASRPDHAHNPPIAEAGLRSPALPESGGCCLLRWVRNPAGWTPARESKGGGQRPGQNRSPLAGSGRTASCFQGGTWLLPVRGVRPASVLTGGGGCCPLRVQTHLPGFNPNSLLCLSFLIYEMGAFSTYFPRLLGIKCVNTRGARGLAPDGHGKRSERVSSCDGRRLVPRWLFHSLD